jgi:hypothetical protein
VAPKFVVADFVAVVAPLEVAVALAAVFEVVFVVDSVPPVAAAATEVVVVEAVADPVFEAVGFAVVSANVVAVVETLVVAVVEEMVVAELVAEVVFFSEVFVAVVVSQS